MVWVVFKQSQPELQDQRLLITCETNHIKSSSGFLRQSLNFPKYIIDLQKCIKNEAAFRMKVPVTNIFLALSDLHVNILEREVNNELRN